MKHFFFVITFLTAVPASSWLMFNYIEFVSKVSTPVKEITYTGSGVLDLTFPCIIDKHNHEIITDNIYAIMAVDSHVVFQGNMELFYQPFGDPAWGVIVGDAVVKNTGALVHFGVDYFWLQVFHYLPQYPNSTLRLTWNNPQATNWRLTLFKKGRTP